jgi:hypothetical protein
VYVCLAALLGALSMERQSVMRETDAKEGEHPIAKYNTHRRSAAHTDRHFCQQDPTQMEPAYRNTVSVQARRGKKKTWQATSTSSSEVTVEGVGLGEGEGRKR